MAQTKLHEDDAHRQAAYRRRKGQVQAKQSDLAVLARSLHAVIQTAVIYKAFPLPDDIAAPTADQTLRNLIMVPENWTGV